MLNTLNRFISKSAVSPILPIWLIFVSLFGKCTAQDSSIGFVLPLVFMIAGCSVFCCCFWFCFAGICYGLQKNKGNNNIVFMPRSNTSESATTTAQNTFNLQRHQCDWDYPQSQTSEPVSLPEATLHQGDAPPAYEEAIEMETVGNIVTS
jgi:hypothetical protein